MNTPRKVIKDPFVWYLVKRWSRTEDHKILVCEHVRNAIDWIPDWVFLPHQDCKKWEKWCLIKCDIND